MINKKKDRGFQAMIKNGGYYEKALLVASGNAEKASSIKGFLTEYEIREIMSNIHTNQGVDIYNSIMDVEKSIRLAVYDLENEYLFFESRFWMYAFFYNRYSLINEIPDSLNSFLYDHPEARDDLLKCLKIGSVDFSASSEGTFIKGKMKPEVNKICVKVANGLDSARIRVKTVATCIKDYMEEKGVIIEIYRRKVEELEEKVRRSDLPLEDEQYKYVKKRNEELMEKLIYEDGIIAFQAYEDLPIDNNYYKKFRRQSIERVFDK